MERGFAVVVISIITFSIAFTAFQTTITGKTLFVREGQGLNSVSKQPQNKFDGLDGPAGCQWYKVDDEGKWYPRGTTVKKDYVIYAGYICTAGVKCADDEETCQSEDFTASNGELYSTCKCK